MSIRLGKFTRLLGSLNLLKEFESRRTPQILAYSSKIPAARSVTSGKTQIDIDSNQFTSDALDTYKGSKESLKKFSRSTSSFESLIEFASACYLKESTDSLAELSKCVYEECMNGNMLSRRPIYLAVDLALKLDRLHEAADMLQLIPKRVGILETSLRVRVLARLGKLDDALLLLEDVLNEDCDGFDPKAKICDIALDELCSAIKSKSETLSEMQKFRDYQRLLTKYRRRTKTDFKSLLLSPILLPPLKQQTEYRNVDSKIVERIVKLAPSFTSNR